MNFTTFMWNYFKVYMYKHSHGTLYIMYCVQIKPTVLSAFVCAMFMRKGSRMTATLVHHLML